MGIPVVTGQVQNAGAAIEVHPLRVVGIEADRADRRRRTGGLVDRDQRVGDDVDAIHQPARIDRDVDDAGAARAADQRRCAAAEIHRVQGAATASRCHQIRIAGA